MKSARADGPQTTRPALKVMAKREQDYGTRHVLKGELFELTGQRNDELMLRLGGYFTPWAGGAGVPCPDGCGREFATQAYIEPHKLNRHSEAAKKAAAETQRREAAQPALRAELEALHPQHTHRCPTCGAEHAVNSGGGGRAA